MLSFTTDFKAAAMAGTRDPRALIKVHWGNSLQDTSVVITSNDANYADRKGQITSGESSAAEKWAFIGNEFLMDGTFKLQPAEDTGPQVGWFGATLGDVNGNFVSAVYIQVAHDARPYSNITIVGDEQYNEYPVDFDVTFTHDAGTHVINVIGNSDRVWTDEFTLLTGVTSVKLEVTKWSAPNTIVKITQFTGVFEEFFDSSDIINLDILEESNSDTGSIPVGSVTANELDLVLLNTDRRFSYGNTASDYKDVLIAGRKIEVWLGFVLPSGSTDVTGDVTGYVVLTEGTDKVGYMPYGVYWSKDWESSHDSLETNVTAFDMISRLREIDFLRSDNYTDTLGNIVDAILNEAKTYIPDLSWTVSTDTISINWVDVAFEVLNFQDILKKIGEATLSYSYVDRTGELIVGSRLGVTTPVNPEQELTLSDYFDYSSTPRLDELVNSVRVGYTLYNLAAATENIYSDDTIFEISAGETELKLYISWEKSPVQASSVIITFTPVIVSGPVSMDSIEYATGADITIIGTAGDTFSLSAVGKPYTLTEITETVVEESSSIAKFGRREMAITGNVLITSAEQAFDVGNEVLTGYGDLRQDGELSWPATVLVAVGDTVEVTEFHEGAIETKDFFLIKRQSISFDGALDGELELRRG